MKRQLFTTLFACSFLLLNLQGQEFAFQTFKDRRVINSQSVETLPKGRLDVRITHRFGDLVGDAGGWQNFYGLENAADILIGAEYGLTDNIDIGVFRTKGASINGLTQLLHGIFKYRLSRQTIESGSPFTFTALGMLTASTQESSDDENALNNFDKTAHRFIYFAQLLAARKFNDYFSLQFSASYTHRNIVRFEDVNGIVGLGIASRIQISKVYGVILDTVFPVSEDRSSDNIDYFPSLGIGLEIDTGGHVFQINLTNSRGIMETDFIPNTSSDWLEGEFRLGFTISRLFNL